MASGTRGKKDQEMAGHLVKMGIHHGKRLSKPMPNSSGNTLTSGPGSSKAQRMGKNR